jgi:hypothetical protein
VPAITPPPQQTSTPTYEHHAGYDVGPAGIRWRAAELLLAACRIIELDPSPEMGREARIGFRVAARLVADAQRMTDACPICLHPHARPPCCPCSTERRWAA